MGIKSDLWSTLHSLKRKRMKEKVERRKKTKIKNITAFCRVGLQPDRDEFKCRIEIKFVKAAAMICQNFIGTILVRTIEY